MFVFQYTNIYILVRNQISIRQHKSYLIILLFWLGTGCIALKTFIVWLSNLSIWAYMMKVIPEARRVH
jgi:hypothetical protein